MNINLILKGIVASSSLYCLQVNAAIFEVNSDGYLNGQLKFVAADNSVKSIRQSMNSVSTFYISTSNAVETQYGVFDGKKVTKVNCKMGCKFDAYDYLKLPVEDRPVLVVYRYEN